MKAMVMTTTVDLANDGRPLRLVDMPAPEPGEGEILVKVLACGVCHTELDEIEGRTPPPSFPVIPGHQVVGRVERLGAGVTVHRPGDRVGIAWIYSSCGECRHCRSAQENLCRDFKATGRDADGGYAEYMKIGQDFAYPIPEVFTDVQAAPLLCAGAVGYRSLRLTGMANGDSLGLTGFGASAHLVLKMVKHRFPDSSVHVFARNPSEREFALELGASWAGDIGSEPPEELCAVIETTPAWRPVLESLAVLTPGGRLVINAIRKEEADKDHLAHIDYPRHLWMEKEIKSVANVARSDVVEFLKLASEIPIRPVVREYRLEDANRALLELKRQKIRGAKVLVMG